MARTAAGQLTVVDISDGIDPIVAFATNENHTFSANEAGTITQATREGFVSGVRVFVGQSTAAFTTAASLTANVEDTPQYRVASVSYINASGTVVTPTGWGTLNVGTVDGNASITVGSIGTTAEPNVTVRVRLQVRNNRGTVISNVDTIITLSIVRNGAGGQIVELITTGQSFRADAGGTTINDGTINPDVIISIETQGSTGNITIATSTNGGAFTTRASTNAGVGQIAGYDTDGSGAFTTGTFPTAQNGVQRLQITRANFGNNRAMAIRVSGASGGQDTITLFRVDQGTAGNDAIVVNVVSSNGNIFRNGAGAAKTLTAMVFDAGTGSQLTSGVEYTWTRSGSGSVSAGTVRVTSSTDRTVVASGGVEASGTAFSTIIVGEEDVDTSEVFTCTVDTND